jgi:hypothetical protein
MKMDKEIQTAWQIWYLINQLSDLLLQRYEENFPDIDTYELQDPTLGPLGPLDVIDATEPRQDKTEE